MTETSEPLKPTLDRHLLPTVHQCLADAMGRVRAVGKLGQNREQGYSFKKIDDFMTAANEAMAAAGVHQVPTVLQRIVDDSHTTRGGAINRFVDMEVRFRFYGPAGDYVDAVVWGEARDAADKATNKALTAAQKYALMYVLMVPTSEIRDADSDDPQVYRSDDHRGQQADAPRVPNDVREAQEKLIAVGAQLKMYPADIASEFEKSAGTPIQQATAAQLDSFRDVLQDRADTAALEAEQAAAGQQAEDNQDGAQE